MAGRPSTVQTSSVFVHGSGGHFTFCVSLSPSPWLPVLSHIEPPALRGKAAVDELVAKATVHGPLVVTCFIHLNIG